MKIRKLAPKNVKICPNCGKTSSLNEMSLDDKDIKAFKADFTNARRGTSKVISIITKDTVKQKRMHSLF